MSDIRPPVGRPASDDDTGLVDLHRYLAVIAKRKWVIAATCVLGVALTVLYTSRQTRIYAAEAKIVIDSQAPQVLGSKVEEVVQLGTGSYWSNEQFYNTQLEIIEAYDLAEKTVTERKLESTQSFAFEDPRLLGDAGAEAMSREERIRLATDTLHRALSASIRSDSQVVTIAVHHADATLARDLANAHVETFKRHNLEIRQTGSAKAETFLAGKRDAAGAALREVEKKLLAFKRENDLLSVSLEDQTKLVTNDLGRYKSALADARIKRLELGALRDRARAALADGDVLDSPIFGLTGNQTAIGLKDQYVRAKQQFTELSANLGVKHPRYIAQKRKVDELYGALVREAKLALREIEERYKTAADTERRFLAETDRKYNEAKEIGDKQTEYDQLRREYEALKTNYGTVAGRHDESELSGANPVSNIRDHERARTPIAHVFPQMRLNLAVALLVSLVLGLTLAFLLEYLDRTIKSAEDVENTAGVPALGMIPLIGELAGAELADRDLYVHKNPASQAAECARSIRTNILFSSADRELKLLTVSSPNPEEGKTTAVMYLGTTMAQSGQKVLLIDTDLRRPRLDRSVGVSRGLGVTNLIFGDATYEDAIKTTEIPNLFVLPCGPIPPNPAELLLTNRFREILDELRERYDWILLDSPPLGGITDAVVLGKLSDGIILVVEAGRTVREHLARARRSLSDVDANVLGVILNELDLSDRKYASYYQYKYQGEAAEEAVERG